MYFGRENLRPFLFRENSSSSEFQDPYDNAITTLKKFREIDISRLKTLSDTAIATKGVGKSLLSLLTINKYHRFHQVINDNPSGSTYVSSKFFLKKEISGNISFNAIPDNISLLIQEIHTRHVDWDILSLSLNQTHQVITVPAHNDIPDVLLPIEEMQKREVMDSIYGAIFVRQDNSMYFPALSTMAFDVKTQQIYGEALQNATNLILDNLSSSPK